MKMLSSQCLIVVLLVPAFLIGQSNGELTAILLPQQVQDICQEEALTFRCLTNGTAMLLYSPPVINETMPLLLNSRQNCERTDAAAACILLEDGISFLGALTLYIQEERNNGTFQVFCNTTNADGMVIGNVTYYRVLGDPARLLPPALKINVEQILNDTKVAQLNISWNLLDDVEQYMVNINEAVYHTTKSYIMPTIPYGNFIVTIIAINRCGKYRQQMEVAITKPPRSASFTGTDLIACASIAGGEGLILIILGACLIIYGCYKYLKNK